MNLALDFAINHLKPGGNFLCKSFQGVGFQEFYKSVQQNFNSLISRKPKHLEVAQLRFIC